MDKDSWAICRIFKKANTMAQRALSHSWVSQSRECSSTASDIYSVALQRPQSCSTYTRFENGFQHQTSPLDVTSFTAINLLAPVSGTAAAELIPPNLLFSPAELSVPSMVMSLPSASIEFEQSNLQQHPQGFVFDLPVEMNGNHVNGEEDLCMMRKSSNMQWFPFSLAPTLSEDEWKGQLPWESSTSCPSELSTCYSTTTKCYT
ncbi:hypothetical protein J5N97_017257 [Dioscorea zingiberensis]|uniref:Uncharacterized protein n=1 Tax=Dioscorea zingiberensis TaxID=325984 RepID=A0A9D5CLN1_9LILI|nr:hypothetical protein J5N97_017257 [Dioscorea zingiberensis]